MVKLLKAVVVMSIVLAISACARFDTPTSSRTSASSGLATDSQATTTSPTTEFSDTGILSFLPKEVLAKLTVREKSEAASAQFYALQYGRVGATREWTADSAVRGEISVGPYIKVNALDCREFNHIVIVGNDRFSQSGTSCREQDGQWGVVG